jgi:ribonuclease D
MDHPEIPPPNPAVAHRRKRRAAAHRLADDASGTLPAEPTTLVHELVPAGPPRLVENAAEVEALAAQLAEEPLVAFDTEFIGEETFRPRVCLVQIATSRAIALVDPLRLRDDAGQAAVARLFGTIASSRLRTLVHAGYHDVEALRIGGAVENVVDTQVAAAMIGLPWPSSLATVLERLVGHRPPKGHTFTDWDARPLSPRQLGYAADDVRYLPLAWHRLEAELAARGRLAWAVEESAALMHEGPFDPLPQVKRIARGDLVGAVNRAVVTELVKERYELAERQNLPPRAALPDAVLAEIARTRPTSLAALRPVRGIPGATVREGAEGLVAAVARALARAPQPDPLGELLAFWRVREQVDAAWPRLRARCAELELAAELVIVRGTFTRWFGREIALRQGLEGPETIGESRESPFAPSSWREAALGEFVRTLRDEIPAPPAGETPPSARQRRRRRPR